MAAERSISQSSQRLPQAWRDDFPALKQTMNGQPIAFLDTAASAQKPQIVIDTMRKIMEGGYANIHRGLYTWSQDLTARYEAVRRKIADFIRAENEKSIVFTRNTTEAINLVAQSWARQNLQTGDEIILTHMEHHANIVPWQLLVEQIGAVIKVLPIRPDGSLDLTTLPALLNDRTRLIACVHTSNALGTVNPVQDIVKTVKTFNSDIKVLVDGSQAVVHMPVNVTEIGCDFYTFTGHKLYGPTGVGVLYAPYDLLETMPPYQGGGDMIERVSFDGTTFKEPPYRFEAGTPPILEVIGLGAAVDYLVGIGMDNIQKHEAELLSQLNEKISTIPGITIHGTAKNKTGVVSFTMDDSHPSDVGMILDQCGVAVRTGHHCCMPLMGVLGVDATARASLGLYSNERDIDQFIQGLEKAREMLS